MKRERKGPTLKIMKDTKTDGEPLRVFLFAGNGHELFASTDTVSKKLNGERTIARIAKAMAEAVASRAEPDR